MNGKIFLAILIGVILFVLSIIGLNYFGVISLPTTNFTGKPAKITLIPQNFGFQAGDLTLTCPLDSAFCKSERLVKVNKQDAVAYKAASQSGVLNLINIKSLENTAVLTDKKVGKKYFYESVLSKDGKSCYTIAYTLPDDAVFGNILDLKTFLNDNRVATLGPKTFEIEGENANVVIQVRNSPQDPGVPCSLIKKSPDFFKAF